MNDIYDQTKIDLVPAVKAAEILGLSESTLAVWRSTGRYQLPFIKVGRKVHYRLKDLHTWLESRRSTNTL